MNNTIASSRDYRIVSRLGPNLTLADVAKEAGVSPATLVQRFRIEARPPARAGLERLERPARGVRAHPRGAPLAARRRGRRRRVHRRDDRVARNAVGTAMLQWAIDRDSTVLERVHE